MAYLYLLEKVCYRFCLPGHSHTSCQNATGLFDIVVRPCLAMFRETGHLSVVDDRLYTLYYQTSRPESGARNTEAAHNYSQITMPSVTLFYKDDIRKIVFQDRTKPSQAVIANRRDNLSFSRLPGVFCRLREDVRHEYLF